MPPPIGAVQATRLPGQQVIRTGRGMARAVESETPGIFHRHALNYLITTRSWSPPRQALVWAALDVAIASALQAAWYYKWLSPRHFTSRRPRPIEYARDNGLELDVLYDRPDELNPMYITLPTRAPAPAGRGSARAPAPPRVPYDTARTRRGQHHPRVLFGNDPRPRCSPWSGAHHHRRRAAQHGRQHRDGPAGAGSTGAADTRPG
jgi:hypothetical protein